MSTQLETAVARVAIALRKLTTAASSRLGGDCYVHALLGRALLADLGFEARLVVGFAAWRIGRGDGDVVAHTLRTQGHVPPGGRGFPYHAWLNCNGFIVDFTTYQLRLKAQALDAADGGHTTIDWCPDYFLLPPYGVRSYEDVQQAMHAGVAYYEARPELEYLVHGASGPDPDDLQTVRLILANPGVTVYGPRNLEAGGERDEPQRAGEDDIDELHEGDDVL
jgi:hypothetical protein